MNTVFRKPEESDRDILMNWIDLDPYHSGKVTPEFFFGSLPMVVGDMSGPGVYIRIDAEPPASARLHMQFGPDEIKSGKTLLRGWPTFRARLVAAGMQRVVFESVSPRLIDFCVRAFGFNRVEGTDDYELGLEG